MKRFLLSMLRKRRRWQQMAVVATLDAEDFDPEMEFFRVGKGPSGQGAGPRVPVQPAAAETVSPREFPQFDIVVPQTLIVTTEGSNPSCRSQPEGTGQGGPFRRGIRGLFLDAEFPDWLKVRLSAYLSRVEYPSPSGRRASSRTVTRGPTPGCNAPPCFPTTTEPGEARGTAHHGHQAGVCLHLFPRSQELCRSNALRGEEDKMAVVVQRLVGSPTAGISTPRFPGWPSPPTTILSRP